MGDVIRREAVYLWYYFSVQLEQIFVYWVLGLSLIHISEPTRRS